MVKKFWGNTVLVLVPVLSYITLPNLDGHTIKSNIFYYRHLQYMYTVQYTEYSPVQCATTVECGV